MKKISLQIILLLAISSAFAQTAPIMVCNQSGTICTPYYNINTAVTNALNNDFIYLPGGTFNASLTIDKKITIIGAGYRSDSSSTTDPTIIIGNITMTGGSDSSLFEGFRLNGGFSLPAGYLSLDVKLKKLWIQSISQNIAVNMGGYITAISRCNNWLIQECVIDQYANLGGYGFNLYLGKVYGTNNLIRNSIINSLAYTDNSTVSNCIMGANGGGVSWCDNSTFKNSIHIASSMYSQNSNLTVLNLATNFHSIDSLFYNTTISSSGHINNQPLSSFFVNNTTPAFSESNDYNLLGSSPCNSAGNDGTDIGVYGGSFPWSGSLPSNPHIYFKNISASTDANGNLPVNFKVRIGN